LQSAHIVTLVRDNSKATIELAVLRISRSGQVIDNLYGGRTGNFASRIDVATGQLAEGWRFGEHLVLVGTDVHPQNGQTLRGFVLPHRKKALELVQRATILFLPSRCLDWDVALTPNGPLETNMHWDPPNQNAGDMPSGPQDRAVRDFFIDMRSIGARNPVGSEDCYLFRLQGTVRDRIGRQGSRSWLQPIRRYIKTMSY
jgi:hypothetical protein